MPIQELDEMENLIGEVADEFGDVMKQLYDEEPGFFQYQSVKTGETKFYSTKATWNAQVDAAGDEFHGELKKLVEKFEVRLLQGEFA
tara:strand:- start:2389 stop:2649 length:261 start_codon:yes stop_codon:yes gene_type:complete